MRSNFWIVFVLFGLFSISSLNIYGQTESDQSPHPNTVLYKIKKEDSHPSYLFGTIHLIPKDLFIIKSKVKKAFDNSDALVMELSLDELEDPTKMFAMMGMISMKDGVTLSTLLSPEDLKLVEDYCTSKGMPFFMLNTLKPFFSAVLLSQAQNSDSEEMMGYELEFWQMAKEENKEILSLESTEEQMSIFDKIPYKDQAEYLVESVKNQNVTMDDMDELVQVYLQENLTEMADLIYMGDPMVAKYSDLLLDQRNLNWISKIENITKDQSSFFAVGAGHLIGENGLLNLLEKQGYLIEPILE